MSNSEKVDYTFVLKAFVGYSIRRNAKEDSVVALPQSILSLRTHLKIPIR